MMTFQDKDELFMFVHRSNMYEDINVNNSSNDNLQKL